jgi:selenocysteine lyase/cysteine desulfurase
LEVLRKLLEEAKDKYPLIIGSFTAGSNVTGLTTKPGPVADLMHEYGGYICFDYAGAGPYKDMRMQIDNENASYLDAIYISPHKFVGGPGTPGLLCISRDFANVRNGVDVTPTIAGGGTVTMVAPMVPDDEGEIPGTKCGYESILHVREEAGTPGVVEAIRCGMAFHVRNLVGPQRIEQLEGEFALKAVKRLQANKVWVMGDTFSNILSTDRLSITSFNIWAKIPGLQTDMEPENVPNGTLVNPFSGKPLMLHFHFVAALLNDIYGIQARSGCACAGPLSFRLFGPLFPFMTKKAIDELFPLAEKDFHSLKPGFCRVNFNYFIDEAEFDYILSAIEQIAEHGWKLLPLYSLCLKTGQYWYNGLVEGTLGDHKSFNRFDAVRRIHEIEFLPDGAVAWNEPRFSTEDRSVYLQEAMKIYDNAPTLVRKMLFRFRDLRRKDVSFPEKFQEFRFFALGSEVLPHLGIDASEIEIASQSALAKNDETNPMLVSYPKHPTANPWFTFDRPRG